MRNRTDFLSGQEHERNVCNGRRNFSRGMSGLYCARLEVLKIRDDPENAFSLGLRRRAIRRFRLLTKRRARKQAHRQNDSRISLRTATPETHPPAPQRAVFVRNRTLRCSVRWEQGFICFDACDALSFMTICSCNSRGQLGNGSSFRYISAEDDAWKTLG